MNTTVNDSLDVPMSQVFNVQQLQAWKDMEKEIKLPFIISNKIIMSPGNWNNYEYGLDVIKRAFVNTDWSDKLVRSLFVDHADSSIPAWAGELKEGSIRFDGKNLLADLVILDKSTAIKLAYGAKFGISPKIAGNAENNIMQDFIFANFSIVTNPAVKTAWINNRQMEESDDLTDEQLARVTDMEARRKRLGMTPAQFYAAPRTPPSRSALPIFDKAHVRNAMARFNQTHFVSAEEKSKARGKIIARAHKFGIKVGTFEKKMEDEKMAEKEQPKETTETKKEVEKVEKAEVDFSKKLEAIEEKLDKLFKKNEEEEKPEEPAPEEKPPEEPKEEKKIEDFSNEELEKKLFEVTSVLKSRKTETPEAKENKKVEQIIEKMANKIELLEKQLNEPEEKTVEKKTVENKDADEEMMEYLKNRAGV